MIIRDPDDVTAAVLAEAAHTADARSRELLVLAVKHLHAFVREAGLTEAEFQRLCAAIVRAGQVSGPGHNEVVLAAGSLGVSALVCLLNNAGAGEPTTANLLGPFWREGAPATADGGSIVRSPTPGPAIFVTVHLVDPRGTPVAGAEVDVWHASPEGFYENQDPAQAEMNLRGRFVSQPDGCVRFRSVKPVGYPVPVAGPVGNLLRLQGRHNLRPAHLHLLVHQPGFKTQFTQLYSDDDAHLHDDVQFAVTAACVAHYRRHDGGEPPASDVQPPWYTLEHRIVLQPGEAAWPRPPISGKTAAAERPAMVVLEGHRR